MLLKESLVLDIVSDFPETEDVFRQYDEIVGKCVLCHHLFDTLEEFSSFYHLDVNMLISKLEASLD